jgi:hypothetical protein
MSTANQPRHQARPQIGQPVSKLGKLLVALARSVNAFWAEPRVTGEATTKIVFSAATATDITSCLRGEG